MTPIPRHSVDIPVNPLTPTARKRHQETLQASPALSEGTSIASSDGPATPKSTFMASPQIGSGLGKETSWSTLDSESSNFSGFSSKTVQSNTTASTQSSPQQRFHVTNNRLSTFSPAQQFHDDDSTASIHAQDSRVGGGEGIDWFKIKSGKRHVPLPMKEAPYLLGYEKSVDTWFVTIEYGKFKPPYKVHRTGLVQSILSFSKLLAHQHIHIHLNEHQKTSHPMAAKSLDHQPAAQPPQSSLLHLKECSTLDVAMQAIGLFKQLRNGPAQHLSVWI